jgi:hypothetical protein
MFTAAYKDEFYLALRNALHAEVDSWHESSSVSAADVMGLWQEVFAFEKSSRNPAATVFHPQPLVHLQSAQAQ